MAGKSIEMRAVLSVMLRSSCSGLSLFILGSDRLHKQGIKKSTDVLGLKLELDDVHIGADWLIYQISWLRGKCRDPFGPRKSIIQFSCPVKLVENLTGPLLHQRPHQKP